MKKLFGILSIVFIILTFAGAGYVVLHKGQVNAGYAVIPMVFTIVCQAFYRNIKDQ